MEKHFVDYNQALALKELGFDEPCFAGYRDSEWIGTDGPNSRYFHAQLFSNHQFDDDQKKYCSAPLKSQVFEWVRKKYNTNICISWRDDLLNYDISLTEMKKGGYFYYKENFNNYEEAESECIDKLIEIVKNK